MENMPLLNGLIKYIKEKPIPFHTPGHKGKPILGKILDKFPKEILYKMDLTEVSGLDDLHSPSGIIEKAQKLLSEAYDVDYSFFLVNGSTSGIEALITTTCSPGDKIIVPRNAHKSIINGLIISGAEPVYVKPCVDKDWGISLGISADNIEYTLTDNKGVKAVFLVSPTYQGICSELEEISIICNKYDIPLLIDEAHGPHLKFSDKLPIDSISAGASGSVQSAHKHLGSLTQSSWLHVKKGRIDIDRLKYSLQLFQSTSPSYILMASLDCAREQMVIEGKRLLDEVLLISQYVRSSINNLPGARCYDGITEGKKSIFDYDLTKLVISCKDAGISGRELERLLRQKHNIQVEYSDYNNITLFLTIGNKLEDAEELVSAIKNIIDNYAQSNKISIKNSNSSFITTDIPKQMMTPRDAFFADKETTNLKESVGQICGEVIAPYPPGIPLICPGEKITKDVIDNIRFLKEENIPFQGPSDKTLKNIKVIK